MAKHRSSPSPAKARKIVRHGTIKGKKITPKQDRLFRHIGGKKK